MMEQQEKSLDSVRGRPGFGITTQANDTKKPKPVKWARILAALAAGRSLNRFEAERELHDHCLPSTISAIQSMGVVVARKMERVPGWQGLPADVARYWLEPPEREKALQVLVGVPR